VTFTFTPATKEQAKARIALAGPSGSGKTFTALVTARALAGPNGRVAVIDTERESASLYADEFAFDTLNMHAYDPRDLARALAAAAEARYDVVVVDSLSHFWMGIGGMLEQVDNAAKRSYGGNSFGGWKEARPIERAMIDALLAYPGHVIVTMRTKTEWVVQENERGRKEPKKIGTRPEQREGIEYEFTIVGDMDLEHTLVISKSRAKPLSDAVIRTPDETFGLTVLDWLGQGKPMPSSLDYRDRAVEPTATYAELRGLYEEVKKRGLLGAAVMDDTGETVSLGDLIVGRGKDAQGREQGPALGGEAA
jgi:DNA polymerase III delta prime subunit